jgi:hypothetical protein
MSQYKNILFLAHCNKTRPVIDKNSKLNAVLKLSSTKQISIAITADDMENKNY